MVVTEYQLLNRSVGRMSLLYSEPSWKIGLFESPASDRDEDVGARLLVAAYAV